MKRSQIAADDVSKIPQQNGGVVRLTCVYAVNGGEGDEQGEVGVSPVNTVDAEEHCGKDGHGILATVDQMRENVPRVVVTSNALQSTPNRW